jgi:ankyrin repeat protein
MTKYDPGEFEYAPGFENAAANPQNAMMGRWLKADERHGKELCNAARAGDLEAVKEILAEHPEALKWRGKDGEGPLFAAAEAPSAAVAEHLVALGLRADVQTEKGETPLMRAVKKACETGATEVLTLLIRRGGADVKASDKEGRTAAGIATAAGSDNIAAAIDQAVDQRMDSQFGKPVHNGVEHTLRLRRMPIAWKK